MNLSQGWRQQADERMRGPARRLHLANAGAIAISVSRRTLYSGEFQPPTSSTRRSASTGPQVSGSYS
jgi:hypothetical protein